MTVKVNEKWMEDISEYIITNITNGDESDDLKELIITLEEYISRLKENYDEDYDEDED